MNQTIGYARVSMDDPNLDTQRNALRLSGCSIIYEDTVSGKTTERPKLEQCQKALRAGDKLVVWRLDRLGGSLRDLVRIVTELDRNRISFESLTEKIEIGGETEKSVSHVFSALSEFERNLIRERGPSGFAARVRGRAGGRKPKLDDKQVQQIKALLRNPDMSVTDIARRYDVSRTTIYKHVGVVSPDQ